MREAVPAPILSTYAVSASMASMSRKSRRSAPSTGTVCQRRPPSSVRRTVPAAPLAQATLALTALTPRSRAITPLRCDAQWGPGACQSATAASTAAVNVFTGAILPQSPRSGVRGPKSEGRRPGSEGRPTRVSYHGAMLLLLAVLALQSTQPGPADYRVRLDTSKGPIVIAVHRAWAPHGADRFYNLVTSGYYDQARFFRIRKGTWVQFGIAADPNLAQAWRTRTIPDDPYVGQSNTRGTVAFAFKDPNGRTTQVFINLKDNSATHDKEPFVVFGKVEEGMAVADALYAEYAEAAGGGIRAGHQDPVFEGGNAYLTANFPLLDYIRTARIEKP